MEINLIQLKRIGERIKLGLVLNHITSEELSNFLGLRRSIVENFAEGRIDLGPEVFKEIIMYLRLDKLNMGIPKFESSEANELKVRIISRLLNDKSSVITLNGEKYIKSKNIERIISYE